MLSISAVPTYTVSGTLIPDKASIDFTDVTLKLTNSADSTEYYTTAVVTTDDTFSYIFTDVISGTYVLSLESPSGKVSADEVIVTVNSSDTQKDLQVEIAYMPGDVNGDGLINGQDYVRLMKYLANYDYDNGTSTVEIFAGADTNGDGLVNGKDLVRLKKYLADYDYDTGTSTVVLGAQI